MKIKYLLLHLICLFFVISCQKETSSKEKSDKDIGDINFSKKYPKSGDTLTISSKNPIDHEAYFLYAINKNIYANEFEFLKNNESYEAKVIIPDSAQVLVFNFNNNEKTLHNDHQGFSTYVYDQENMPIANASSGKAYIYKYFGYKFDTEPKTDSLLNWLEKDFEKYPETQSTWDRFYVQLLKEKDKNAAEEYANKRIAHYENITPKVEKNKVKVIELYSILGKKEKAEELENTARKEFPRGEMMKEKYISEITNVEDIHKKVYLYDRLQKEYKASELGDKNSYLLTQIANTYVEEGNWDLFLEYSSKIKDPVALASLYNSVAWDQAENDENLAEVKKISAKSLSLLENEKESLNNKPSYTTTKEYRTKISSSYQMYADTYAFILNKLGENQEAIKYAKIAVGEGFYTDINERFVQFLIDDENFKAAQQSSSKFIEENQANEKIKEYFKVSYQKNNPSTSAVNLESELRKLESKGETKAFEDLKKEKMNTPAPNFTLKSLDIESLSLSDLKGKTVILDFWANWCAPCKASFPGMKEVVEQYQNNDQVVILFINTFENEPIEERITKSKEFLNSKEYPFRVLLDTPIKDSRDFKVAQLYDIKGIPTKVIIDPKGNIAFKKVGYNSNNEQMIKEIQMMVELSQQ